MSIARSPMTPKFARLQHSGEFDTVVNANCSLIIVKRIEFIDDAEREVCLRGQERIAGRPFLL